MNNIFKRKPIQLILQNKRRKVDNNVINNILGSNNTTPANSPNQSPKNNLFNFKINKKTKIYKPKNKKNHNETINNNIISKYSKESIPKRIREMVWNTHNGNEYDSKCYVKWCNNNINVFNYQVGHDIPESKGGTMDLHNLKPICGSCNQSMGNRYTIQEWNELVNKKNEKINITSGKDNINYTNNFTIPDDNIETSKINFTFTQKISIAVFIVATIHILTLL